MFIQFLFFFNIKYTKLFLHCLQTKLMQACQTLLFFNVYTTRWYKHVSLLKVNPDHPQGFEM